MVSVYVSPLELYKSFLFACGILVHDMAVEGLSNALLGSEPLDFVCWHPWPESSRTLEYDGSAGAPYVHVVSEIAIKVSYNSFLLSPGGSFVIVKKFLRKYVRNVV